MIWMVRLSKRETNLTREVLMTNEFADHKVREISDIIEECRQYEEEI